MAEAPPLDALPRRLAVWPSASGVDHRAGVLQQPGGDGVSDGKIFAEAGLQTQLQCPENPSHDLHSDLHAAVRL